MIIDKLLDQVIVDIKNERFGKSGFKFPTSEKLIELYGISFVTSLKLLANLTKKNYLLAIGNKKYIMNGLYSFQSDLYKYLNSCKPKIGIVLMSITNPFFSKMTEELYKLIISSGYEPVLKLTDPKHEKDDLISLVQEGCSGIFSFFQSNNKDIIDIYSRLPVPVVFISDNVPLENANSVNSDNQKSGYYAAMHFIEYGYDSLYICLLSKKENPRYLGFMNYIKENGIPFDESHILVFNLDDPFKNKEVMKTLLEDKSDRIGVFCFHDLIAEYLFQLCKFYMIDVPNRVGIIGYDKLDSLMPFTSELTTFSYSFDNIAKSAIDLLIKNMKTLNVTKTIISERTRLIPRSTTARLKQINAEIKN